MVLAVNEAGMNIIQHAYNIQGEGIFRVTIYTDGKELTFCLTDYAPTVDKKIIKSEIWMIFDPVAWAYIL